MSLPPPLIAPRHLVRGQRRALPEHLAIYVQIETRLLEVLDDPLGDLLPGIAGACSARIGHVPDLFHQSGRRLRLVKAACIVAERREARARGPGAGR